MFKLMAVVLTINAASGEPKLPAPYTCDDVRAKVEEHGKAVAWTWAVLHGYSQAQIREAKKCLRR